MPPLRLHLRVCTVLWLLCQTLSLAALVPADCCAAHHVTAAQETSDCHQQVAAEAEVCQMDTPAGADCPMHAAPSAEASAAPCAMRGLCNAPASALAMLIPLPGVLAVVPSVLQVETSVALVGVVPDSIDLALSHDPPPPRA